jgi:hypothetical protein
MPTTTTTVALEVSPTVTCPGNYSWNGSDCGSIAAPPCVAYTGPTDPGDPPQPCGPPPDWTPPPNVPASITCPGGYSLEDSQATGYYRECVLS